MFVTLKEQRHYGIYIKYICLDATFLTSKYGGLHVLLFIERYVLEKRFIAYKEYQKMVDEGRSLVPAAINFINEETDKSTHLRCVPTGAFTATVEEYTATEVQHYSVSITDKYCTCNRYRENELPCRHAICFLRNVKRESPIDYANDMYKTTTIVNMYQSVDGTCSTAKTLDNLHSLGMTDVVPPPVKVKKGRKRTKRYQARSKKEVVDITVNGMSHDSWK
jgi:SWIM zinc finger